MWKMRKKIVHYMLLLVGLSNLFLFFGFFLNGFSPYDPMTVSIYTAIFVSWNFLSIVSIVVIGRIGREKRAEVVR
jgi:hypothetical protein